MILLQKNILKEINIIKKLNNGIQGINCPNEIIINSNKKEFILKLEINDQFQGNLIGTLFFDINGISHTLNLISKEPEKDFSKLSKGIPLFQTSENSNNMWENKTNNYRSQKNIYVTPFISNI